METTKTNLRVHCRWMIERDMPEVLAIERASFEHPWTEEEFLQALRPACCIGMVAEHGERVVGFFLYELHKRRLHVLDFAVDPEFDRRGVEEQMVAKLISKLAGHSRTRISLVVRETNLEAQLFFRKQRFLATGVLREYYPDTGEDAYAMEYCLDDGGPP